MLGHGSSWKRTHQPTNPRSSARQDSSSWNTSHPPPCHPAPHVQLASPMPDLAVSQPAGPASLPAPPNPYLTFKASHCHKVFPYSPERWVLTLTSGAPEPSWQPECRRSSDGIWALTRGVSVGLLVPVPALTSTHPDVGPSEQHTLLLSDRAHDLSRAIQNPKLAFSEPGREE